ncbi:endonuclease/exonuclease/phosphatase family protein [Pyxidicoccus fallax]|uniref:Endonuclease/exonuclease/phosphatase family protein n=1 Tax=Pyxidicoccus fallax TaxID=394095 RepID=A0A848LNS5_9BACT|nr:endonuclease/exonuclease/phosphatase family protein [Pyxidicoccus fallax]NMO19329.1 endonuclease/exonuclease/phosphatase family protein [Pyxidicoccus fallax]NPC80021.1 endonuclease/exonuclease/phosphatase family protein [Pyxidicoccus fallax]
MAMKVMTFNVLQGGEERFDTLVTFLARESPDVLVLQECLGWDDGGRLHRVAEALGVPQEDAHRVLGQSRSRGSGRCYHVAVVSRPALRSVSVHNNRHFLGHCIVQCELDVEGGPVTLFGTHFDAHEEKLRYVEARYLRSLMDAAAFREGRYLLAGDLNSLSRKDPYPVDLGDQLRRAGTDKYGHPPRFDVIDDIEAYGWVDTLRERPASPKWVTARRNRGGVTIDYRTDYVFASPRMAERLMSAEVIDVGDASDHNPLVATFR